MVSKVAFVANNDIPNREMPQLDLALRLWSEISGIY